MEHFNPITGIADGQKFITFGEIMLRLTPPNYGKIRVAHNFEAGYGGSEANIALALANLISVHQKKYIGSLSAYCGAVSAATGAACGVAYLKLKGKISEEALYRVMSDTITNSICTIGGMVCDGAKSSCAAKIAAAVDAGIMGYMMYLHHREFRDGEGIVGGSVDDTIANVGRLAQRGMKQTDHTILRIMSEG